MNTVGLKLRHLRKKQKLTQSELAAGIVNRSYISQLEKGMVQPSYKLLLKFSERLQCDIQDFFEEENKALLSFDIKKALSNLEFAVINDDFADAEEHLNDIEKNLSALNQRDLALYYFCQGRILQSVRQDTDGAVTAFEKSYELYCNLPYCEERLRTSNELSSLLINEDRFSQAFTYLNEAYDDSIAFKASGVEKISLLNNLGLAHAKKGEYYSAIRFIKQALSVSSKTAIYYQTGIVYMVLGLCYRRMNQYEDAKGAYAKALLFFEGTDDQLNLAGTYTNLGILSRYTSDAESAVTYLKSAHDLYNQLEDSKGILNTLFELAVTYQESGKEEHVLSLYKSFNDAYSEPFTDYKFKFLHLLGDMHETRGELTDALKCYHEILDESGAVKDRSVIKDALKKVAAIACGRRDEKMLFYVTEKYLAL